MKNPVTEEPLTIVGPILQKTWVDLDDFAECFQWDTHLNTNITILY